MRFGQWLRSKLRLGFLERNHFLHGQYSLYPRVMIYFRQRVLIAVPLYRNHFDLQRFAFKGSHGKAVFSRQPDIEGFLIHPKEVGLPSGLYCGVRFTGLDVEPSTDHIFPNPEIHNQRVFSKLRAELLTPVNQFRIVDPRFN